MEKVKRLYFRKAVCVEITKDGAQCYRCIGKAQPDFGEDEYDNEYTIWLAGIDRAKNVRLGDVGQLFYISEPSHGHYYFEKIER